ncbi:MAG TPA: 3-deoxy-manno-octulosonate cytidylyltransferase [Flavobacteriales bacterium]|jgi:3-deoxy-manno-octulosonate cytidylyltransferase (CMP-KDO synthetase)|nr:3-deoxy-manno-octulosonate cytidylyltransferase [Flavobacteriales bacterium]
MKFLGIIPARYGSKRLEGKPLLDICGKSMIRRVYEQSVKALDEVYVATDDQRIRDEVLDFGGKVVMTDPDHNTGTNRCLEALEIVRSEKGRNYDVVVNIQGDEPLLNPSQVLELMDCYKDPNAEIATLVTPVIRLDDLFNESEVFVVFDKNNYALYFSRSVIPHVHGKHKTKWLKKQKFYKHLGLYAYTVDALRTFANMPRTSLEVAESLEQNRWIQNGGKIKVSLTEFDSIPVDTIDDLERVREMVRSRKASGRE